jgi:serine/threonine protein kinase
VPGPDMNPTEFGNQTTLAASVSAEGFSLNAGDLIGRRFRIVRKLGEGGMAVVYEAQDEKLGERRALKFAKKGYSAEIPPETRSALRVTHENICRTYEIHTADSGTPMDFISRSFSKGRRCKAAAAKSPSRRQRCSR